MLLKFLLKLRSESGFWMAAGLIALIAAFFLPESTALEIGSFRLTISAFLIGVGVVLIFAPPSEKVSFVSLIKEFMNREERRRRRPPWIENHQRKGQYHD